VCQWCPATAAQGNTRRRRDFADGYGRLDGLQPERGSEVVVHLMQIQHWYCRFRSWDSRVRGRVLGQDLAWGRSSPP
jgi:hypothetical protein